MSTVELDAGAYEVLRVRLAGQADALAARADDLDARRAVVFGGDGIRLVGTARLPVPRGTPGDVAFVDGLLVVGFADARFAAYRVTGDGSAEPADPPWLRDPRLLDDLAGLLRYYRHTRLLRLRVGGDELRAVLQTGPRTDDVRVARWAVGDGVRYLDARSVRDEPPPPAHDLDWVETTRADHVDGAVLVDGVVAVSTTGGELTVSVPGAGTVHSEPVSEPLQSLADASVGFARVGTLVVLRVLPYKETGWRHLVYNPRTRTVARLDDIGRACRRLPGDDGLVFPGGYYLAAGGARTFHCDVDGLEFERGVQAASGADVLYAFRAAAGGRVLLLPYDVARAEVPTAITGRGYALGPDGTLYVLPSDPAPGEEGTVRMWRTPYAAEPPVPSTDADPIARVGAAAVARAVADCRTVRRMVTDLSPSVAAFRDVADTATRLLDRHYWLDELRADLTAVRDTAERVLVEHERHAEAVAAAGRAVDGAAGPVRALVRRIAAAEPSTVDARVRELEELRLAHGRLTALRDRPHVDPDRIDALAAEAAAALADASARAVRAFAEPAAFAPFEEEVDRLGAQAQAVDGAAEADQLAGRIAATTASLQLAADVATDADTATATDRTQALDRIAALIADLNRVRATLDARARRLRADEDLAAVTAELALIRQAAAAGLATADTAARCDGALTSALARLETLETLEAGSRHADRIAAARAEITAAFTSRRQTLLDEAAGRTARLVEAGSRILATLRDRARVLSTMDGLDALFATDPLVSRLRAVEADLRGLGEAGRAEELAGRLVTAHREAARALRDRVDLFEDGGATVRFGRYRFAVNTGPAELTLVPHGDGLAVAVSGTDLRVPVRDRSFAGTRRFWDRRLVSESPDVYRGEYLAVSLLEGAGGAPLVADDDGLPDLVRRAAEDRYQEGYTRGVHDHDATAILRALLRLRAPAGLLRYPPATRAAAQFFWAHGKPHPAWARRAASLARARDLLGGGDDATATLTAEVATAAGEFLTGIGVPDGGPFVGEYLVAELAAGVRFSTSSAARALLARFHRALGAGGDPLAADLRALDGDPAARWHLAHAWLDAFAPGDRDAPEAAALLTCEVPRHDVDAELSSTVDGLLGEHPRIRAGGLELRLDEILTRVRTFEDAEVPAYRAYRRSRAALLSRARARLDLDSYRPRVSPGFVRNRLVDEVYLPLIGANLARQLGVAGQAQSGLLLLLSPPGYGKTTLMEYVADRLGLLFVRVDGPSLGDSTTSLDPAAAPDAAARREVQRIGSALRMGTNVLLYLDDIQHTSTELLQRFVSLCDGQRRLGGVDLRGKRFAVCMAGNPYTGTGRRFRVPDMLANRADVWNLGDVVAGRADLFAASFVENALASLGTDGSDGLLRHLERVRGVVLAVNREYVASAGRDGDRFQLQGSYRDMNAIAARLSPVMTDAEVDGVVDEHYRAVAGTLGAAAGANLRRFAELRPPVPAG